MTRYREAFPFASKHFGSTLAFFEEPEDADEAETDAEAAADVEDDFDADELSADAEADDALEPDGSLAAEGDNVDSALAEDGLSLVVAAIAELGDWVAPCETSAAEERAPLTWPFESPMKIATPATSATTTATTIAATTRPRDFFGTENDSGA